MTNLHDVDGGLSHWAGFEHFKPTGTDDNWGDPHKINRKLLVELEALRNHINMPVMVTSGYRAHKGGRGSVSQHAYGVAADIVVPDYKGNLVDLAFQAMRFKFRGIGLYRDWTYNERPAVGLHVDVRRSEVMAQWFCYKDASGVQVYLPLSVAILKDFGVL